MKIKNEDVRKVEFLFLLWKKENQETLKDIRESGGLSINEPEITDHSYTTCSGKGKYYLEEDKLVFEGYRNSFGATEYFGIIKYSDSGLVLITEITQKRYEIPLEILSYETSQPSKHFWLTIPTRERDIVKKYHDQFELIRTSYQKLKTICLGVTTDDQRNIAEEIMNGLNPIRELLGEDPFNWSGK